ncbi:MAG: hypothetical protein IBJ04_19425 [Hydrogenophaga sp.]|uniref:hypothetical protein n=1 Tax=Hydrogenophaga sp. TaxID=1904254 RepID=UPI00257F6D68|nr:hypothetical protein [Hydrogenophaga sp.]MBL0946490.1 hypothetical protein [Hydrogenophaga sp.]
MTRSQMHTLMTALGDEHLVRPSAVIEDATEVRIRDTFVNVEWDAEAQRFELTVPLPGLIDDDDDSRLRLYRALLAWQWREAGGADRLGFGVVEALGQTVGMASLAASPTLDAHDLKALLVEVHDDLQAVWIECCTQVLAEQAGAPTALRRA